MDIFEPTACGEAIVTPARLMTPAEIKELLKDRTSLLGEVGRSSWCLCGDVSHGMFAALVESGAPPVMRLTVFPGSAGGYYVALTQQAGHHQHRFLLPLYEPAVGAFLRHLREGRLHMSLGRQGQDQALVIHGGLDWWQVAPVAELIQSPDDVRPRSVLPELAQVLGAICRLDAIPSVWHRLPVRDLSVSYVTPADYMRRAVGREPSILEQLK